MGIWLDDEFYEHAKFEAAGDDAGYLWVVGMAYASRNKTGGHIPAAKAHRLTNRASKKVAERLVTVNLWERTDTGYYIHDYPEYQRASERRREEDADKKRRRSEHARKAARARYGADSEQPSGTDRASPEQPSGSTLGSERAGGEEGFTRAPADTRPNHSPSVDSSSSNHLVGEHAGAEEEEDPRIREAVAVLVERKRLRRPPEAGPINDLSAWREATAAKARTEHGGYLGEAAAAFPLSTPDELADLALMRLEPPPPAIYTSFEDRPASPWADVDEYGQAVRA